MSRHMPKTPLGAIRFFLALPVWQQIAISALARFITVVIFDFTTMTFLQLTGASLQKSVWVSGFYFPAGLIVFFTFVGSPWAVIGVALGTFSYSRLFRDISLPMEIAVALPSALALLITMTVYTGMMAHRRQTRLSHISFEQILAVSCLYAFWNFVLYYLIFTLFNEQLNAQIILTFNAMATMFCGDFAGAAVILSIAKLIFAIAAQKQKDASGRASQG